MARDPFHRLWTFTGYSAGSVSTKFHPHTTSRDPFCSMGTFFTTPREPFHSMGTFAATFRIPFHGMGTFTGYKTEGVSWPVFAFGTTEKTAYYKGICTPAEMGSGGWQGRRSFGVSRDLMNAMGTIWV